METGQASIDAALSDLKQRLTALLATTTPPTRDVETLMGRIQEYLKARGYL